MSKILRNFLPFGSFLSIDSLYITGIFSTIFSSQLCTGKVLLWASFMRKKISSKQDDDFFYMNGLFFIILFATYLESKEY